MRRIGTLNGKPIVQGDKNLLKKNNILYKENNGKIELSEIGDSGKIDNITQGGNNSNSEEDKRIYAVVTNEQELQSYQDIITYIKIFLTYNAGFIISKGSPYVAGTPNSSTIILEYIELNPIIQTVTDNAVLTTNSLEEYESIGKLDSNNRPFKIITKEEFDKDLTEEEARKIAAELSK